MWLFHPDHSRDSYAIGLELMIHSTSTINVLSSSYVKLAHPTYAFLGIFNAAYQSFPKSSPSGGLFINKPPMVLQVANAIWGSSYLNEFPGGNLECFIN